MCDSFLREGGHGLFPHLSQFPVSARARKEVLSSSRKIVNSKGGCAKSTGKCQSRTLAFLFVPTFRQRNRRRLGWMRRRRSASWIQPSGVDWTAPSRRPAGRCLKERSAALASNHLLSVAAAQTTLVPFALVSYMDVICCTSARPPQGVHDSVASTPSRHATGVPP